MRHFNPIVARIFWLLILLPVTFRAFSQDGFVRGKVTNTDHQPVQGVSITIKNHKGGTATNAGGEFSIPAKKGDVLTVTYIGFEQEEVTVQSDYLPIEIHPANNELNEVVVTATGIKKEVRRLGYATQTVDASRLTQAREPNPLNSLKGNVAGLSVNINPELGHAPSVSLRGDGSPMYVVDGVPMTSDTYNVNPDDIESFTILKGPNAAALYGFAGQSGAIIINTKKGSRNKKGFTIDLNSSTQFSKGFIALPLVQDEYGPGEYGTYAFGDGNGGGVNDYDYDGGWGPRFRRTVAATVRWHVRPQSNLYDNLRKWSLLCRTY